MLFPLAFDAFQNHGTPHIEQEHASYDVGNRVHGSGEHVPEQPAQQQEPGLDDGEGNGHPERVLPVYLLEGDAGA